MRKYAIVMPRLFGDRAFRLVWECSPNSMHKRYQAYAYIIPHTTVCNICKFATLHCCNIVPIQHGGGNCYR